SGGSWMASVKKIFGKNLARLASREGFSKTGLAVHLGVKPPMVSRWVRGQFLPETADIDAIADYFKLPVGELFTEAPDTERLFVITEDDAIRLLAEKRGWVLKRPSKRKRK